MTGVYIIFEIQIFAPTPFLIYIFYPTEIYYIEGVRTAGETFLAFFTILYISSKSFFPPAYYLAIFLPPNKQKKIHPCYMIKSFVCFCRFIS